MKTIVVGVIAFVLALPGSSAAHRLDEYLQAARVSLSRDQIALEVDLTPGANIATVIVALLDRDADRRISPIEAEAYGRAVVRDLILELDGRAVPLTLTRVETPSVQEMNDGLGTIQLEVVGAIDDMAMGRHRLYFRNDHRSEESVYLVNALVPAQREIAIAAPTRDPRQREIGLEYDIRAAYRTELIWLVLAGGVLSALVSLRVSTYHRTRHAALGTSSALGTGHMAPGTSRT